MCGSAAVSQTEFALLSLQLSEGGSKKAEENSSRSTPRSHILKVTHSRGKEPYAETHFAFSLLREAVDLWGPRGMAAHLTEPPLPAAVSSNWPRITVDGDVK